MSSVRRDGADGRLGAFLIGARGAVSTCVTLGVAGLRSKRLDATGLVTATQPFARVPLARPEEIVLGGLDVRKRSLREAALELASQGIVSSALVDAEAEFLAGVDARIGPGWIDAPDRDKNPGEAFDAESVSMSRLSNRDVVRRVQGAIETFRAAAGAARVVVVNLASTEAMRPVPEAWNDLNTFERDLERNAPIPASSLYAYAALEAGHPYVNFTPSLGAKPAALNELAKKKQTPHAGCDGKTGETLVKTVLGPMFRDRNLRVLAWEGYNMLGNSDGATLNDPAHKASKVNNKDEALRKLLGDSPELHTRVGIDYVPSLGDWKTAMDFIHFRGFLGTKMSLQFTWSASDSALAAPLVLDLIRLADLSKRRGESGAMAHTAAFFKSPIGSAVTDFYKQHQELEAYARAACGD